MKYEIKKQSYRFFSVLLATLIALVGQPMTSSVVKGIIWIGVRREGRGYIKLDKKF